MKILLVLLSLLNTYHSSASKFKVIPLEDAEDTSDFYPVNGQTLYIHKFNLPKEDAAKYATKGNSRVLKVPSTILFSKHNFEPKDKLQIADFESQKTYNYHIKDDIYLLYFDTSENELYSNVSLILSDDPKIHNYLARNVEKRPLATGFAYRGSKRKMQPFKTSLITSGKVPDENELYKTRYFKANRPAVLRFSKIFDYKVIIYANKNKLSQGRHQFFFQKEDGTYHGFPRDSNLLDSNNNIKVYELFDKTKIMRMFDDANDYGSRCEYMALVEPDKLSMVSLLCFIEG